MGLARATELRREWEEDARSEDRDPKEDAWLKALPTRRWSLETIEISRIKLDPRIMNYVDVKNRYAFQTSLASRSQELKETIERFASVIWPLIIKKEGYVLVDGYCRARSRTYAYVGYSP